MNERIKELLKPEILNSVNGLELIARVIVEGFMSGSNKSQSIGVGQEFSQYKNYQPGDDLRQLDWKIVARTERYFIKQAEIETNITVKFIIDASRSMAYEENGVSKLQYAKVIAAALGYLARKQSDTIGLFTINDQQIGTVQPRFEQQQFIRFLNELVQLQGKGKWSRGLEKLLNHHGKEMIIFITDLYDEEQDILQFVARLKTPRNEVIVFHLIGRQEAEFDFDDSFTFEDLESSARIKTNPVIHKKEYAKKFEAWLRHSRLWTLEKQISYQLVFINESVDDVLRKFLGVRKSLIR